MSKPVKCLFSYENKSIPLLTIDKKEQMTDTSGNPILINTLTPILTENVGLHVYVVYNGYKGYVSNTHFCLLGMVTTIEKDGPRKTEGLLRLRKNPDPEDYEWVTSSTGQEITVGSGTVFAILKHSSMLARLPGVKYSDVPMVKIGIHYNDGIYEGWLREVYIERFYRQ